MSTKQTTEAVICSVYNSVLQGADKVKMVSETHDTITGYKVGLVIRIDVKPNPKTKEEK